MLGDILSAISLGRKLIGTIADLRRDIQSVRSGGARQDVHAGRLEALEGRLDGLESQAKEHDAQAAQLEQGLKDVLRATEALAERVSTIFWIASVGCGLALIGLIVSVVALARTIR
jgi:phage-related minor tail protein